jgi:hypothetical protein
MFEILPPFPKRRCRTPAISRRALNLETILVSRMKATLFAVGCMALLGCGDAPVIQRTTFAARIQGRGGLGRAGVILPISGYFSKTPN